VIAISDATRRRASRARAAAAAQQAARRDVLAAPQVPAQFRTRRICLLGFFRSPYNSPRFAPGSLIATPSFVWGRHAAQAGAGNAMTRTGQSRLTTLRAAFAAIALAAAGSAGAIQSRYNLAPPVTQIARDIHWLHWMMLIICGVIFVAVFGVMFYSIWAHRKSKGAQPADFHESTKVEVVWTVIPFLIVIGMALPATKTVVAMKDTTNADLTIKVTGYQWKWGYDYLRGEGEGISFLSKLSTPREQIEGKAPKSNTYLIEVDNELVVPVGRKVRVITTANDVIHAWMVPALGVKQDAIPGFVRDTWFRAEKIGTYRGQCAELCGRDHAFMPIVVRVVSQDEYTKWVAEKKAAMAAAADDPGKIKAAR
jgi:cytochrome c oxidase subunit 2